MNFLIFIKGDPYLSTFEGYLIGTEGRLCLNDCRLKEREMKCVYDLSSNESDCSPTTNPTKRYRTLNNNKCHSNCGNFGKNYTWCVFKDPSGNYNWDYCTRHIALNAKRTFSTDSKFVCMTNFVIIYDDMILCHSNIGLEEVNPDGDLLFINYKTEDGTDCVTPCVLNGSQPRCYDHTDDWKKCYLNPDPADELIRISINLKNSIHAGVYSENGYQLCKDMNTRDVFNNSINVETVAKYYEDNFPTVLLKKATPEIITNNTNPVLSFTVIPVVSHFEKNQINLPVVVRALITNYTLRPARKRFNSNIDKHYRNMNPIANDERGQVIPPRLGGPMEKYNIFPQYIRHNRENVSRWLYMERDLVTFITSCPNSYVEYTAVLSYDFNHPTLPYRPKAVALRPRQINIFCSFFIAKYSRQVDDPPKREW